MSVSCRTSRLTRSEIALEEAGPAAGVGAADRLRVTAAQCPLKIVVTSQVRGGHAKGDAVPEDGGDEAVRAAVYLALGQRVELDGFRPAGQQVGEVA